MKLHVLALVAEQVTLGEEGFFAQGSPYTRYNPFGTPGNVLPGWSKRIGQVSSMLGFCPRAMPRQLCWRPVILWHQ